MGYTSSGDPYRQIRLKFPDRDSAVDFAERRDWHYVVREDAGGARMANPWAGETRHRLHRGVDAPGAWSRSAPIAASRGVQHEHGRPVYQRQGEFRSGPRSLARILPRL
jgi:hypothetical protein